MTSTTRTSSAAGTDLTDRLAAVDGVEQVVSYWSLGSPEALRSTDGDTALVVGRVVGEEADIELTMEALREEVTGDQGEFQVLLGGQEAVFADIGTTIEGDLLTAEMIAIPLTMLLLLFVFRGVVAASLPLMVGVIAVLGTFLSLFLIGSVTDVSIYAINLTTALGLGLAIDYSLFIVSRFREELRNGKSVELAVVRTVETAGKTILISALTVAASLSALLVFPQFFLRSFAYAGRGGRPDGARWFAADADLAARRHRPSGQRVADRPSTDRSRRVRRHVAPHRDVRHAATGPDRCVGRGGPAPAR